MTGSGSGEALARLHDHVSTGQQPGWLGRPRLTVTAAHTDRCLTLVDDAIAWVCAARNADATAGKVSSLPLLDFLR